MDVGWRSSRRAAEPQLHIISTIHALVHPSFPPAWATACIPQVSLKLVALRDGGRSRRKWEVEGGSVKITYNEPCCWRNKRTWDGKSSERERWSRRKNINLSGISTPHPTPSTSQQLPGHFTNVWEKICSRVLFECYMILSTGKHVDVNVQENIQYLNMWDDWKLLEMFLYKLYLCDTDSEYWVVP